jgi:hypothetical protein
MKSYRGTASHTGIPHHRSEKTPHRSQNDPTLNNEQSVGTMEADDDFVSTINEKSCEEVSEESYKRYENNDLNGLKRLLQGVESVISVGKKTGEDLYGWLKTSGGVEHDVIRLEKKQKRANNERSNNERVAEVTAGLKETLKHDIDLIALEGRVDGLFKWHDEENESSEYMAPYFPVIQSSGTGKTRLLIALREASRNNHATGGYECRTVLCRKEGSKIDAGLGDFFDRTIQITSADGADTWGIITNELNSLLQKASMTSCNKLVLLFDEANNWLDDDGNALRCVSWWLRMVRDEKVVAVFAGTTPNLANSYTVSSTASERFFDPKIKYVNWTKEVAGPTRRYDPFFHICTIGCFHQEAPLDDDPLLMSDFEKAAFFGRPLFAYLQKEKKLFAEDDLMNNANKVVIANQTLHSILKRMLVGTKEWESNNKALCSILGSRVHMRITTSFSSDLVAKAYAHLVYFHHPDEAGDIEKAVARICFMPDPVCAALAMGLMNEDWALTNGDDGDKITGKGKFFWSTQAMKLLSSGLCLPEKGNAGEIMVALYMLFCGDVLRRNVDNSMRTFSVPLSAWYSMMKKPPKEIFCNEPKAGELMEIENEPANSAGLIMDVNFIQVCRNYFRAHSWATEKALQWMYKSATAAYVYPDCKAIDLVAAIRVVRDGATVYQPMLVSVKCYVQMFPKGIEKAIDKMKNLLKGIREKQKAEEREREDKIKEEVKSALKGTRNMKNQQKENRNKEIRDRHESENPVSECLPALCLLVLIGAQKEPTVPVSEDQLDSVGLGSFPDKDTYRLISVPADDKFGISDAVNGMMFSSHGFVYGEDE